MKIGAAQAVCENYPLLTLLPGGCRMITRSGKTLSGTRNSSRMRMHRSEGLVSITCFAATLDIYILQASSLAS